MTALFLSGWYPLLPARRLGTAKVSRTLAGAKLALWRSRTASEPHCSEFATGEARAVTEQGGWILVWHGDGAPPPLALPPLITGPRRCTLITGHVRASLGDVGENILDTTHTSVVHAGYLRRPEGRRLVEAALDAGDGWVSATYPPGAAPAGWGARLLGAHRYTITDTFRAPAVAEVVYTQRGLPAFAARFQLTPVSADETYVAATITVPGDTPLSAIKLAALRLFFLRIFDEDRTILEMISVNRHACAAMPLVFAPQDILRPAINAILDGRLPRLAAPRAMLKV